MSIGCIFRCFLLLLLVAGFVTGCGRGTGTSQTAPSPTGTSAGGPGTEMGTPTRVGTGELRVFAAASLTEAFGELGKRFEQKHEGSKVTFNFAGSQQLAQQIGQGAPADVFASASGKQMDAVVRSGQVGEEARRPFVKNKLIVIYPRANPAKLRTLGDLARKGVKIDLAAREVPAGQYSLDFLDAAAGDPRYGEAFKQGVLANVVSYEENVRAVVGKVSLGEADAGIVYESDVAADTGKLRSIEIPDKLNQVATYPIAPIKGSSSAGLADAFIEYVLSPEGQRVLERYGFIPMGETASGRSPRCCAPFAALRAGSKRVKGSVRGGHGFLAALGMTVRGGVTAVGKIIRGVRRQRRVWVRSPGRGRRFRGGVVPG